jgi:hypothetical protein
MTTELNVAPRSLQLQNNLTIKFARRLKKNSWSQKKVARMHFKRVEFVLVCPPVEKIFVAQRSVQRFCVTLAE